LCVVTDLKVLGTVTTTQTTRYNTNESPGTIQKLSTNVQVALPGCDDLSVTVRTEVKTIVDNCGGSFSIVNTSVHAVCLDVIVYTDKATEVVDKQPHRDTRVPEDAWELNKPADIGDNAPTDPLAGWEGNGDPQGNLENPQRMFVFAGSTKFEANVYQNVGLDGPDFHSRRVRYLGDTAIIFDDSISAQQWLLSEAKEGRFYEVQPSKNFRAGVTTGTLPTLLWGETSYTYDQDIDMGMTVNPQRYFWNDYILVEKQIPFTNTSHDVIELATQRAMVVADSVSLLEKVATAIASIFPSNEGSNDEGYNFGYDASLDQKNWTSS